MTIRVGRFVVEFDPSAHIWNTLDEGDVTGVRFEVGELYCDAFCHKYIGERINISSKVHNGYSKDIPLHMGTAGFLPEGVVLLPVV